MKQPRINHVYRFAPFSLESILFNGLFALHEIAEQDTPYSFIFSMKIFTSINVSVPELSK